MLYLLDASVLIDAADYFYQLSRVPQFWGWLQHVGAAGHIKIPIEQFEEITGDGDLAKWLRQEDVKKDLLLQEEAIPATVARVTAQGYAPDLDETEIEKVGYDPFLIAYGLVDAENRTVITFETSAPSKQRANRKVPDVCKQFGVPCHNLYHVIEKLDFSTGWHPK